MIARGQERFLFRAHLMQNALSAALPRIRVKDRVAFNNWPACEEHSIVQDTYWCPFALLVRGDVMDLYERVAVGTQVVVLP